MSEMTFGSRLALLEKRPLQMAHLGLTVSRWAYVEQAMAFFYDYLLAQKGEPREFGWPIDGLGVASFGAVRSVRTKLDLLYLAIEWRLGEKVLKEFQSTTATKIESASRARNIVAHGLVEFSDAHPEALIVGWNGQDLVYTVSDFVAVLDKIKEAHDSVTCFHNIRARSLLQVST